MNLIMSVKEICIVCMVVCTCIGLLCMYVSRVRCVVIVRESCFRKIFLFGTNTILLFVNVMVLLGMTFVCLELTCFCSEITNGCLAIDYMLMT